MGVTRKITLSDRFSLAKHKFTTAVKNVLVDDTPPGVPVKKGADTPTIAAIRSLSKRYSIGSLLPYESYDPETQMYYNRDTVGFMLYSNPSTGLSPTQLKTLNGFFNQNHPPDATIQVSLIADPNIEPVLERWRKERLQYPDGEAAEFFELLANKRVEYLAKGKWRSMLDSQPLLVRNYHLVISYVMPSQRGTDSQDMPEDDIERMKRIRNAAKGTLRSAGMLSQNLEPSAFINIMNGVLNPSYEKQPILQYDDKDLISSQVVDEDTMALFSSGCSTLVHKGEHFSVIPYHVRQYPKRWPGYRNNALIGSFADNIKRIPCPFIATLTVNAPDQVVAKGKVNRKALRATQMSDSDFVKYVPQWKDRKRDWDFTKEKLESDNQMMESFYQIILITPEGSEQESEQALKSTYDGIGWTLSKSRYIPVHALLGALPMGLCQETKKALKLFRHFSTRLSWNCTNTAPWIGEWKGTATPLMTFVGRRGQLCYFNPFDNTKGNYNIAIAAASGAGKSVAVEEMLFCCLSAKGRAFAIDSGGSYKNICTLAGGTYIDFGEKGTLCLNPFSSLKDDDKDFMDDQMPMLKMLICQMASPDNPLSQKQRSVLEKAIISAWKKHKNETTITKVVDELLDDSSDEGRMHDTGKDLAVMLFSYTKNGMFGKYFEGKSNIDLDHPFVVLELDALNSTPDLQSVVLLLLMMKITQVMYLSGNRSQPKMCIIDEAWRLLGRGRAAEFIEEGYRVARKHGGLFATITQKIGDYFKSETAKAAYMNSDYCLYLRQKPEELQSAEASGQIDNSDGKVDVLRGVETIQGEYSEIAINSPDGLAVVRLLLDPYSEKLYSTKAQEADYLAEAQRNGMKLQDAITSLAETSSRNR